MKTTWKGGTKVSIENYEYPKLLFDGVVPKPLPEGSVLGEIDGVLALFTRPGRLDPIVGRGGFTQKRIDENALLRRQLHGERASEDSVAAEVMEDIGRRSRHQERVRY